jgi:hypothetical protein
MFRPVVNRLGNLTSRWPNAVILGLFLSGALLIGVTASLLEAATGRNPTPFVLIAGPLLGVGTGILLLKTKRR